MRIEEQLPQAWLDAKLDWAELLALATGEAGMAVVEASPGRPAVVLALDVRGFLRPIPYVAARMTLKKPKLPMTWQEYLKQAKATGSAASAGLAGPVRLGHGRHAAFYRVGVYVPERTGPFVKMLDMPNRPRLEPPSWKDGQCRRGRHRLQVLIARLILQGHRSRIFSAVEENGGLMGHPNKGLS